MAVKETRKVLDMDTTEFKRAWAKVMAQSWINEEFKRRLIESPAKVLQEHGLEIPEDICLTIDQLPKLSSFEELQRSGQLYSVTGRMAPSGDIYGAPNSLMEAAMTNQPLFYSPAANVRISEEAGKMTLISPPFQVTVSHFSHSIYQVILALAKGGCSIQWIDRTILEADGVNILAMFYLYLFHLIQHQMVYIQVADEEERLLATLIPISPHFQYRWVPIHLDLPYRVSRFAYTRRDEDGYSYLESPLSHARLRLDHPITASLIYQLGGAITPRILIQSMKEEEEAKIISLLGLLVIGNFAGLTTSERRLDEDLDETLMQWDFHDLMFHSRSRIGRHNNMIGGTFRFNHKISPQPAIKQIQWSDTILLPKPDMEQIRLTDPSLTDVIEARNSILNYGKCPITLLQLGEFLYRVARVKELSKDGDKGEFTKRPYPSGGASYELEIYLTVDQCENLARGFYWYDPAHHALAFVEEPNKDTEGLLFDAYCSTGGRCRPQVLITLASRFQRVSWKYQSIAYATILKNVGVLYSTMYLVATAMGLAPCALGVGDSDRFTRLARTDYLKETSVGEFMLGSNPV